METTTHGMLTKRSFSARAERRASTSSCGEAGAEKAVDLCKVGLDELGPHIGGEGDIKRGALELEGKRTLALPDEFPFLLAREAMAPELGLLTRARHCRQIRAAKKKKEMKGKRGRPNTKGRGTRPRPLRTSITCARHNT